MVHLKPEKEGKQSVRESAVVPGAVAASFAVGIVIALACAASVSGHIVTTNVTWNREVSRIFYARCGSCHQPGGTAFSLMSYQEASPWASAIKADVLQQKMPPWGAVKGFGTFRNDEALTPDERDLIQIWVDGGAPEGNPNELPLHANIGDPPLPEGHRAGEITASADFRFPHAFKLDGFWANNFPDGASAQVTLQYPDGRIQPLVWFYEYTTKSNHPFLLKAPVDVPEGTLIRGLPSGTSLTLLPVASEHH